MFTDTSSDKEDLEAFGVRPMQTTVRQSRETVKAAAAGNPVTNLQENNK
jgi:hypothetical protein